MLELYIIIIMFVGIIVISADILESNEVECCTTSLLKEDNRKRRRV